MSCFLVQMFRIVGSSDGEDTIWIQLLVFVILVASWGVYNLVKRRERRFEAENDEYLEYTLSGQGKERGWQNRVVRGLKDKGLGVLERVKSKRSVKEPVFDFGGSEGGEQEMVKDEQVKRGEKDLAGGMELLETDFLLGVVENVDSDEKSEVAMRKLSFGELFRRGEVEAVDSKVLKVYAVDERGLYGKGIQCEAMKELGERSAVRTG